MADPQNNLVAVPEEKAMRDGGTDICWRIVGEVCLQYSSRKPQLILFVKIVGNNVSMIVSK